MQRSISKRFGQRGFELAAPEVMKYIAVADSPDVMSSWSSGRTEVCIILIVINIKTTIFPIVIG